MSTAERPPIAPKEDKAEGASAPFPQADGSVRKLEETDKVPVDQLAYLTYEPSVFLLSTAPLMAVGTVLIIFIALVYYRRAKQWNEIGSAMRLDEEPAPPPQSHFATADLAELKSQPARDSFEQKQTNQF